MCDCLSSDVALTETCRETGQGPAHPQQKGFKRGTAHLCLPSTQGRVSALSSHCEGTTDVQGPDLGRKVPPDILSPLSHV